MMYDFQLLCSGIGLLWRKINFTPAPLALARVQGRALEGKYGIRPAMYPSDAARVVHGVTVNEL
jgi:TctA family transporter